MSKAEINNAIILLRKNSFQAQVHVIKKLSREISKLRKKKGTDEKKAKNTRKADRLAAEILSIKKVKKDDITKFALTNTFTLKEILENSQSEPLNRIMTRIANHKLFSGKITELKKKFPNYNEFLGPGRKKKQKLERKEKREHKNIDSAENSENILSESNVVEEEQSNNTEAMDDDTDRLLSSDNETMFREKKRKISIDESDMEKSSNLEDFNRSNDEKISDESSDEIASSDVDKLHDNDSNSKNQENKVASNNENHRSAEKTKHHPINTNSEIKDVNEKKKVQPKHKKSKNIKKVAVNSKSVSDIVEKRLDEAKIISKQAIVKKFSEVLKEENLDVDEDKDITNELFESKIEIQKSVDPFFVAADGESSYLTVAVPSTIDEPMVNAMERPRRFDRSQGLDSFQRPERFNKLRGLQHKSHRIQDHERRNNPERPNRYNRFETTRDSKWENKKSNKPEKRLKPMEKLKKESEVNDEKLHPSWQAKKKQVEIMKKGFQGSKIVFDEDFS